MNNDIISRSELKKVINKIIDEEIEIDEKWTTGLKYSLKIIDNAPTVEYPFYQEAYQTGYEEGKNERPQGEWIMDNEHTKNPLLWYKCNLCSVYHSPTNYCPNCGAKMKGGAE